MTPEELSKVIAALRRKVDAGLRHSDAGVEYLCKEAERLVERVRVLEASLIASNYERNELKDRINSPPAVELVECPSDMTPNEKIAWLSSRVLEMESDEPKWVVNDIGELGIEVYGRVHFLYKGGCIEYDTVDDDDGSTMMYRQVYKREFGECCHPLRWDDNSNKYTYGNDEDWSPLPDKKDKP